MLPIERCNLGGLNASDAEVHCANCLDECHIKRLPGAKIVGIFRILDMLDGITRPVRRTSRAYFRKRSTEWDGSR